MSPLNGGPAFPWREEDGAGGYNQHVGMSLRDWFAGQALAGIVTVSKFGFSDAGMAEKAYDIADAMLAYRARKDRLIINRPCELSRLQVIRLLEEMS